MMRTCKLLLAPVFLALLAYFLFVSRHRFIDGDEGFYLLAARLVLLHKTPYLDFFYTQAPLLPYVYAIWMKVAGVTWIAGRTLPAVLTSLLGLLIFGHVCRVTGKAVAGLTAAILFASCTLIFAWYPIAKTHSLAALFLFSAYVIISRTPLDISPWWIACSGMLLGLGVDTRSYVAGVAPVFIWWIARQSEASRRVANVLWFAGGLAVGLLPSAVLFVLSPDRYWFNNLGYHAIRSGEGLIGAWRSKLHTVRVVLIGPDDNGLQLGMLSAISLGLAVLWRKRRTSSLLAFLLALFLGLVSLLPTPPYVQYFCLCVPYLIVSAVCLGSDYFAQVRSPRVRWTAAVICVGLLAGYLTLGAVGFRNYLFTAASVIGIDDPDDAPNWTLRGVREVSQAIDELTSPGEGVASFWPGYVFESRTVPYPGFENNFGWAISWQLTPQQRAKYHIPSPEEITSGFAAHVPRVVVLGNDILQDDPRAPQIAGLLKAHGYALTRSIGNASIYVCCSKP